MFFSSRECLFNVFLLLKGSVYLYRTKGSVHSMRVLERMVYWKKVLAVEQSDKRQPNVLLEITAIRGLFEDHLKVV